MLFGFSEDAKVPMFNISLSETRADYIESILKKEGIVVHHIRGYGYVNPVTNGESIHKNRRVEIWVK
jgi:outer membrane protein OmpA-like peptidoglycan-associated protein